MKKKIKYLKWISVIVPLIIIVALIAAKIYTGNLKEKGIPDYNRDIILTGLTGEVTVYRDRYAVPHIYAKNNHDLYMAVGYCMAQDRLWQMDLIRRVATGRLSEIFGEDMIETDLMFRSLRIEKKSKEIMEKSDKKALKNLQSFSDGVNRYISHNRDNLPLEFGILGYAPEEWKPIHSINLIGYMAWDLTLPWKIEATFYRIKNKVGDRLYEELIPDIKSTKSHIFSRAEDKAANEIIYSLAEKTRVLHDLGLAVFTGSNNWAVAGHKSVTGNPILSNDMHLGFNLPGIWYQMHQCVESGSDKEDDPYEEDEGLNVAGVVVPGQPAVISGHNNKIAWGMTNVMIDDMDFFIEKIDPKNPNRYFYKDEWKDMEIQKEKIKVDGGDVVEREIRFTVHGPIISEFKKIKDKAISMHWIGNYPSNELETFFKLNRARNFGDFKDALKTLRAVSQNIVYADIWGNIGLFCAAGIPRRKKGSGADPVPGWTDEYEWNGLVPFEEQPFLYNPPNGILLSANNKTTSNSYPHYISHWYYPPYRYDRIKEMLLSKEKLSVKDFLQMQNDKKSLLVKLMKDKIVDIISGLDSLNNTEKEALGMLRKWDCIMDRESSCAPLFEQFYLSFIENTFKDEMGDEIYKKYISEIVTPAYAVESLWKKGKSLWFDDVGTEDKKEVFKDIVAKSFRDAVEMLEDTFGGDIEDWKWGEIHTLTLKHPLGKSWILDMFFDLNRGPLSGRREFSYGLPL